MREGRTLALMQAAPRDAYFVWEKDDLGYPRALANFLARTDLQIIPLSKSARIIDGECGVMIFDHAVRLPGLEKVLEAETKH